jgi:pyruvate/2-oxoglutarate dehydrogenase complex dihydrolipoamide dehydrogenase (E3) component
MGDYAGSPQFMHCGLDDYNVVHANFSGWNRTNRKSPIAFCMFTDPERAPVGKNELEARRDGIDSRMAKLSWLKYYAQKRSLSHAASGKSW